MKTHEIQRSMNFGVLKSLKDGNDRLNPIFNSNTDVDSDQEEKTEKYLVCRTCEHRIVSVNDKTEVFGSFRHSFLNPAGHVFEIGCFQIADGCSVMGIPTSEWTWFPEYQWQIALCGNCHGHLGWYYSNTGFQSFFGLILNTLI